MEFLFLFMVFCIDTIIAKHLKVFFRDMYNEPFNKIEGRNTFFDGFVIFVSGVMESDIITIVFINAGSSNNRTPQVSADIFDGNVRGTEIGLGPDIESVSVIFINVILYFTERRSDGCSHLIEKDFAKGITQKSIVKMFDRSPGSNVAGTTFRDKCMYMWIPF